jgi:hypothetical protein
MSQISEFFRASAALGRLEWMLLLGLLVVVALVLHPRMLRARSWGSRPPRPSPRDRERISTHGTYRRRSG